MNNTILTQQELKILENIVIKYGKVVSFDQLKEAFSQDYSVEELRNRIALLAKKGWLLRLKKGMYIVLTDISTLGFNDLSEYLVSQALNKESYISVENALQYYSMFDQMLRSVEAVTFARARTYNVGEMNTYRFSHIKKDLYFGFTQERVNGQLVNMAEKEKALLDMLYFRTSILTVSMVLEKLQDYKQDIDFQKLKLYALRYSITMVRIIGFLLDRIGVATDDLYTSANIKGNSYSKMTSTADAFNAKWRLYYDSQLT